MAESIRRRIVFLVRIALFVAAGIALLSFLALCIVRATFDDDDYRRLAIWGVGFFTDYSLTIEGPFSLEISANPYLYAEDLRLHAGEDQNSAFALRIGKFGARIALAPLITGTLVFRDLKADNGAVRITVNQPGSGDDDLATAGDIDLPVFESVQLSTIDLDFFDASANRTIDVRLQRLILDDVQNAGPMFISGKGTFSGQEFELNGRMGALADLFKEEKPYPVDCALKFAGISLSVAGTIKDFAEGEGMQLSVSGEAEELAELLKLLKIDMPPMGRLKFEATVNRDLEAPEIPFVSTALTGNPDIQFSAYGSVANAVTFQGANIDFAGACAIPEILRLFRLKSLGLLEQARVSGSLQERKGVLSVEKLKAEALSEKGATAGIEGRMELGKPGAAMALNKIDLTLQAFLPTSEMLNPLVFDRLPEIGPVVGKAQLKGSAEALTLDNLELTAGGKGPLQMSAKGFITARVAGKQASLSGFDLAVGIKSETTSVLAAAYGARLPELGAVSATYRLAGNRDRFKLERFDVETVSPKDLRTTCTGTISFDRQKSRKLTGEFDLKMTLAAPDLGPATAPLGFSALPALKRLQGEAKISGTTEAVSLNDIALRAGKGGPVRLDIGGDVGRIPFSKDEPTSAIRLTASVGADSTEAFAAAFGFELPEVGPVTGSCLFAGNSERLAVSDIILSSASTAGLKITTGGSVGHIRWGHKQPLEGVDLTLAATAPGWAALPGLEDMELPELGSIRMDARIRDRGDSLNVDPFKIVGTSGDSAPLTVQGRIFDLTGPEKRQLEASFEIMSAPWVLTYLKQPDGKDTLFTGKIKARAADSGIRIDTFQLGTAQGKEIAIDASGNIKDPAGPGGIDFQINAGIPDPPAFGKILGIAAPRFSPVRFEGRLSGKLPEVALNGEVYVGETKLTTRLGLTAGPARPRLTGKISAETVDLREVGIYPEAPPQQSSSGQPEPSIQKRLFGDKELLPFDALKAVDLSVTIDAERLIDSGISIRNLDVDVVLENGRLTIDPFDMAHSVGYSDFEIVIDASGPVPRYHLKLAGEDIDIDDMLTRAHEPVVMSGNISLVTDLKSSGRTAHEIAANLTGVLSFALENGRIWRIVNLLSKDPLDMVLTKIDQRKYTDVYCLINKISFEKGVGTIDILQMDTPDIRAKGAGQLNLGEETMNLAVNPQRKKRLLQWRSAVYFNGSLLDPSISTLPLSEAAELYGTIVLPFVFLPERALGLLWSLLANDKDATPCVLER